MSDLKRPRAVRRLAALVVAVLAAAGLTLAESPAAQAGVNGHQVCINAPKDSYRVDQSVTIQGFNQDAEVREWHGTLGDYGKGYLEACTWDWWWKGPTKVAVDGAASWMVNVPSITGLFFLNVYYVNLGNPPGFDGPTQGLQVCAQTGTMQARAGQSVTVQGFNQDWQMTTWQGTLSANGPTQLDACTSGWLWKGTVRVTLDDGRTATTYISGPTALSPTTSNVWVS